MIIRLCKAALVGGVALLFSLFALGNLTDYDTNWQYVQHTLSMDTTFPQSRLHWRAIKDPALQTAAYWLIIATEAVTAITLWIGTVRLVANAGSPAFGHSKSVAVAGLTLGLLLYIVGFIAIGGEWFAMWQSQTWNGEPQAFNFIAMTSAVLIVLLLPESRETM